MSDIRAISAAFIAARRAAHTLDIFPGEVPPSLEAAYAVQSQSIADWDEPVVGFKVGGIGPQWRGQYPSDWLAGPVFDSALVHATKVGPTDIAVFDGGFAAYEPEVVFRLTGLNRERPELNDISQVRPFVKAVHIGAEIASSPLATLNTLGPGSIISDFGNQAAVVLGQEIAMSWLDHLSDIRVTTMIDEREVGRASVNADSAGPMGALLFLLNHLRASPYDSPIDDELWVSSGAITGVHQATVGSTCTIDYKDLGVLNLTLSAKKERVG